MLIQVGTDEILLDDSTRFAENACTYDVDATLEVWENMPHIYAPILSEDVDAIVKLGAWVRKRTS